MKKYYLVAEKSPMGESYDIRVTDNPRGMEILKEFEAKNYIEASRRYHFSARGIDKAVFCGIAVDGTGYHGEA